MLTVTPRDRADSRATATRLLQTAGASAARITVSGLKPILIVILASQIILNRDSADLGADKSPSFGV